MKYPQARLLIFARAPILGTVKTRLAVTLPEPATTQLYQQMLDYTVEQAVTAALCPVEIWCSPDTAHPLFRDYHQRWGIALHQQHGLDLGQRLQYALQSALTRAHSALVIGSDCPALSVADLEAALAALENGCAVVFNPAEDGGYVLLGLRQLILALFEEMPWGSAQVMAMSRQRLTQLSIPWQELATRWDVDTLEAVQRLQHYAPWQQRTTTVG